MGYEISEARDVWGNCDITFSGFRHRAKFNLGSQPGLKTHRGGWLKVLEAMQELHSDDGIHVETFVEAPFGWYRQRAINEGLIPFTKPWIGMIHNPHRMPSFYTDYLKPEEDPLFLQSLPFCKGLYAMSEYHAEGLRWYFPDIPIEVLPHPYPDESPLEFSPYKFAKNKKLISVGWWLRKQTSIYKIPLPRGYERKIKLYPYDEGSEAHHMVRDRLFREAEIFGVALDGVDEMFHLPNYEYDDLLAHSVILLDLWDSSANNTILECIQRATPIICRRHPATIEYLGENYPLFFDSLDEVEELAEYGMIKKGHKYLKKRRATGVFTLKEFVKNIRKSVIYDLL
jgi:hypothetical protein